MRDEIFDKVNEECGLFGIYNSDNLDISRITYFSLFALQHRGQESAGIAVMQNRILSIHKGMGLANEVFKPEILDQLKGDMAVGHCRYAANGSSMPLNAQPIVSKYSKGTVAVAHNGALINSHKLREEYEKNGAIFQTTSDAEIISYVIAKKRLTSKNIENAVKEMMQEIKGAYSLVVMSPTKMVAARDPHGIRPLCIGKLKNSYIFASETCALDAVDAEFIRDVNPGEVVYIKDGELHSLGGNKTEDGKTCIFEWIYFARPDSVIDGASVYEARKEAGKYLAYEHPVEADVVFGVPDSGIGAGVGYAIGSGIPYEYGFIKNRYIARTFIQPTQEMRERAVKIKLNVQKSVVNGKRVIMVDDSIVRGTTCKRIVTLLREAGATEVHVRISSPLFLHPCYFGTDISSREHLIATKHSVDEIKDIIGADSLGFLSVENMHKIPVGASCGFCDGCFTGKYPMDVPEEEIAAYKISDFIKEVGTK